jgi:hypothetical protein
MTTYSAADDLTLLEIRKTIIVAIASDDVLMERLVLKGGNALDIVYRLTDRSSLDIDFSMEEDLSGEDELADFRTRMFRALQDRFDSKGFIVFDEQLVSRPRTTGDQKSAPDSRFGAAITLHSSLSRKKLTGEFLTKLEFVRVRN